MADITINIKGQFVTKSSKNAGSAGSANNTVIKVVFDKEWEGFAKRIIWRNSKGENETSVLLVPEVADASASYTTHIPTEATDTEGWCSFTVEGYYENNPAVVHKSVTDRLFVAYSQTREYGNISPDEAMQLHAEFEQLMPKVNEKMEKTEKSIEELCTNINLWEVYNAAALYKKGNKVSYNGRCYVCRNDVQGVSPTNENFWLLIADRGEKGERGLQGIKGTRGDQGERGVKGDKGDKGENGINGFVVPSDGFYSFDVDGNGDLWVHYPDENNPPDIYLNEKSELIITTDNNSFNVGNIGAYIPKKGVDYFTSEDIKNLNIPVVDSELDRESENAVQNKAVAFHIDTLYAEGGDTVAQLWDMRKQIEAATQNLALSKALFGGRCLGTTITPEQIEAVRNGTLKYTDEDGNTQFLLIGDYWTMGNVNWRIVDFDYWLNTGETRFTLTTDHHILLMPDSGLAGCAFYDMEEARSGGYYNSIARRDLIRIMESLLERFFPTDVVNVLSHREAFCSNVTYSKGLPGSITWADSTFEIPSEIMMFGAKIMSPGNNGQFVATFNTVSKTQLALFRIAPQYININYDYWLRDNITYDRNVVVGSNGLVNSGLNTGVCALRPVFAIC